MTTLRSAVGPRAIMWLALAGSIALLAALLSLGWENAWTIAAAALFLACVFVCIWAVVQGRTTDREINQAVARLAATRRQDAGRRAPNGGVGGARAVDPDARNDNVS